MRSKHRGQEMTDEQVRQLLRADGVDDATVDEFLNWHKARPNVWQSFEQVALRGFREKGMKRWGAGGIAEVVRYELSKPTGTDFVIDNCFRAYFARILVAKYPELAGKIKFRRVRGLKRARSKSNKSWKQQTLLRRIA